jgi:hypothetical protein
LHCSQPHQRSSAQASVFRLRQPLVLPRRTGKVPPLEFERFGLGECAGRRRRRAGGRRLIQQRGIAAGLQSVRFEANASALGELLLDSRQLPAHRQRQFPCRIAQGLAGVLRFQIALLP